MKIKILETLGGVTYKTKSWINRFMTLDFFQEQNIARLRLTFKRERRKIERSKNPNFARLRELRLILNSLVD